MTESQQPPEQDRTPKDTIEQLELANQVIERAQEQLEHAQSVIQDTQEALAAQSGGAAAPA